MPIPRLPELSITVIDSLIEVTSSDWNRVAGDEYPFTRYEFLFALENSGCVSSNTGWRTQHLLFKEQGILVAILPLYSKTHSWGEYVFDQQWAQAYQHHGMNYYPKLITAIPYTPCVGPRLLVDPSWIPSRLAAVEDAQTSGQALVELSNLWFQQLFCLALRKLQQMCQHQDFSSWHLLFPTEECINDIAARDAQFELLVREDVQFHWFNKGYKNFEHYLERFSSQKRKKINRERRRVSEIGIELKRIPGPEITNAQWKMFYQFYAATYLKRQRHPYLSLSCFLQWGQTMANNILLVMAFKVSDSNPPNQEPIAAALSFIGHDTLYGRYWGCLEEYHSLHFETCYYQGIEFCLEKGLKHFDSGAQGEHKISRGFEPFTTRSLHWIKNAGFRRAIKDFVNEESRYIERFRQDAENDLPFKKDLIC